MYDVEREKKVIRQGEIKMKKEPFVTKEQIEEIVKSYDGFCEWEDRGNIFESRIMLRYLL